MPIVGRPLCGLGPDGARDPAIFITAELKDTVARQGSLTFRMPRIVTRGCRLFTCHLRHPRCALTPALCAAQLHE